MNSRRVGQTLVRLLRTSVSAQRICFFVLLAVLALGIGGASARRAGKQEHRAAAYAHRASMAARDISATPVTTVSAASYEGLTIAPDSIAAAFGAQLATQAAIASDADPSTPGIQLPTQLLGTTVEVNGRRAGLFFVAPGQVNYVVPPATESGMANVVIRSGDGTISNGTVQIAQVAPSVFTANADGRGVPAATLLRIKANGQQSYESLSRVNPTDGRQITKPIDLGPEGERVFLILYVSGLRRANDDNSDGNVNESIRLLIGGNEITPLFAGRQPDFIGLDQVNAEIPRSLVGLGVVKVSVTAAGFTASNLVDIEIAGMPGANPPQVSGFGSSALAGTRLAINGSGFSPNPSDNIVQIAGQPADVEEATVTRLMVMVPPGVVSGQVSVRTNQGQGVSANFLPVRTSISGVVENTSRAPLGGVQVKVTGTNITAMTSSDGAFVLPDVPPAPQTVEVDGGTVGTNPPYPKITLKITAQGNRDNPFSRSIALQQSTGSGGVVGGNNATFSGNEGESRVTADPDQTPITIQTGDYKLEVPSAAKANFPTGATLGTIVLTPLKEARTPVDLPFGYFSSAIVQITPFGVKLDPGGKLILPNTDGFAPSAPAILFRYDPEQGVFVQDAAKASVTPDGRFIETEPGAIKTTSFYFAAVLRNTTTITGRIVEKNGTTPVFRASVNFRGRETFTDGNGSYILRYVPVKDGERVSVEASILRASGRVDRAQSTSVPAVLGGTTKIPPIFMPGVQENRPPTILVQQKIEIDEGKTMDVPVIVTDPDPNQTVSVKLEAPGFVTLIRTLSANASAYALRLAPNFTHAGEYRVVITATDNASPPAIAIEDLTLVVRNVNRPPVANEQAMTIDEDTMAAIRLTGSDPDNDRITFTIASQPTNGTLSGTPPDVTYKPALNFNGIDRFSFKANDGRTDGNTALVVITIRPVNDQPVLSVPGAQTVDEAQTLSFAVSAADVDNTEGMAITATGLPTGATFMPATATSAQFRWTPGFDQAGTYTVTFKATDAGTPPLSDTKQVTITVRNTNRPPVANGQAILMDEDAQAAITLRGSDPDGNSLTFAIVTPPANGTLTGAPPNVTYRPALNFNGVDQFSFKVNDGQTDGTPAQVVITVRPINDPPVLSVPGAQTVNEGQALNFVVSATDIDSTVGMTLMATGAPTGATFAAATGTSGQFAWTPGANQAGVYTVTFKATDGGTPPLSDTKQVVITVQDVPLLNAPQSRGVDEGQTLQFDVSAAPEFAGQVSIAPVEVPEGAVLSNASPAAPPRFRWTPSFTQAGEYVAKFKATLNGANSASETKEVRITVFDVQRNLAIEPEPLSILGAAGPLPQTVSDEGDKLGASVQAGDLNGDGIDDLALGAPGANGNGMNCGKVYVFFGKTSLKGAIDLAKDKADVELLGAGSGDQLGSSLAIGDLNGDGRNDLIAGAPNADAVDKSDAGKVYGLLGPLTASTAAIDKVANLTVQGAARLDRFGASLAAGFIHTKNGPAIDLLVGAPGFDAAPLADAGAVYGFFGGPTFLKLVEASAAKFILTGNSADGQLGAQLAAGNFNGDDFTDFAASAPNESAGNRKNNGVVYLALGSATIAGVKGVSSFAAFSLAGADDGDAFGAAIALDDFNGDARADLIVGAPGGDGPGNSRPGVGEVAVVYGNSAAVGRAADLMVYGVGATGDQYLDALGANLTAGDYTGDGVADIVLGAPGADPSDARRIPSGAVYLLFGQRVARTGAFDLTSRAADMTVYGADPGDNIGRGAVVVGDINGSDASDLILGIPQAWSVGNQRQDAGEVRVLFGVKR
jgi:uncharacterized protein (TIGR03437 family)